MNIAIWGNKDDFYLLSEYFTNNPELGKAVSRIKAAFTPEAMGDKEKWEELTWIFMKELIPFLEEGRENPEQTSAGDNSTKKQGNGSGGKPGESGGQGQKDGSGGESKGSDSGQGDKPKDGSEGGQGEDGKQDGGSGKGGKKGKKDDAKGEEDPGQTTGAGGGKTSDKPGDPPGEQKPGQDSGDTEESKEPPHIKIDRDAIDKAKELLDRLRGKGRPGGEEESGKEDDSQHDSPFVMGPGLILPKQPAPDLTADDIMQIMGNRKAGRGLPFFLETDEAIDGYYNNLVRRIPVKVAGDGDKPVARFPLMPILRRPFDPDEDDITDSDSSRIFFDPSRRSAVPSVVTERLSIDIPIRMDKGNVPKFFVVLVDSSGSMMQDPESLALRFVSTAGNTLIVPWGDESYYHYSILMVKGIVKYLVSEHLFHKVDFRGGIFSDQTLTASNWRDFLHLLYNPLTGGTLLDMQKVLAVMRGTKDAVIPLITDGEISNWFSIHSEFISLAKRHRFFMIQIGSMSSTASDIKRAGLPVFQVNSYEDIVRTGIDLTVRQYRNVINEKMAREAKKYGRKKPFEEGLQ